MFGFPRQPFGFDGWNQRPVSGSFTERFRAYSLAIKGDDRENVIYGGKILLPPSALDTLTRLHIEYPMTFEITNSRQQKTTHAGVLEFVAEEGRIYLPQWMMSSLLLQEGDLVTVKNTSLPTGTFVKIQPQSVDFLNISDPKTVLERVFRDFSTLTKGDIISIKYNGKVYDILVMEIKPDAKGISILETDLEVDFAPPLGYVEPKRKPVVEKKEMKIDDHVVERGKDKFEAFGGQGSHLAKGHQVKGEEKKEERPKALHLPPGKLFFGYKIVPLKKKEEVKVEEEKPKVTFQGQGNTLRAAKKSKK